MLYVVLGIIMIGTGAICGIASIIALCLRGKWRIVGGYDTIPTRTTIHEDDDSQCVQLRASISNKQGFIVACIGLVAGIGFIGGGIAEITLCAGSGNATQN